MVAGGNNGGSYNDDKGSGGCWRCIIMAGRVTAWCSIGGVTDVDHGCVNAAPASAVTMVGCRMDVIVVVVVVGGGGLVFIAVVVPVVVLVLLVVTAVVNP